MTITNATRGLGSLNRRSFLKAGGASALAASLLPGLMTGTAKAAYSGTLDMLAWDFGGVRQRAAKP